MSKIAKKVLTWFMDDPILVVGGGEALIINLEAKQHTGSSCSM